MAPEHNFDCLGIIFTIFKFLGIFVSGAGAIVGTIPAKPSKKAPKPESKLWLVRTFKKIFSKQWALRWVVIGLFVSFFSQFLETMKLAKEAKETIAINQATHLETSNQISLAQSSVDKLESQSRLMQKQMLYIQHMLGEFDRLTVTLECELSSTNPAFQILLQRMEDLTPVTSEHPFLSFSIYSDATFENQTRPTRSQIIAPSRQQNNNPVDIVVGYLGSYKSLSSSMPKGTGISMDINEVCSSNWLTGLSSNIDFMRLVNFIRSPNLVVRVYSRQTTNLALSDADFFSASSKLLSTPSIAFNPGLESILLKCSFDYTNTDWQQTARMGSTHDLDNAVLFLNFDSLPDFIGFDLKPLTAKLDFGKTTILVLHSNWVQEIKNVDQSNKVSIFKATLPPPSFLPIEGEDDLSGINVKQLRTPSTKQIGPQSPTALHPFTLGLITDAVSYTNSQPSESTIFFNRGVKKFDRNEFAGAITNFKKSIEMDSTNSLAYLYCGMAKLCLYDSTGAVTDFDKVIELDPSNAVAYFNRGNSKLNVGNYNGARDDYDKGIELNPNIAQPYDCRGVTKFLLQDYAGAITDFDKAIELNPTNAEAGAFLNQ